MSIAPETLADLQDACDRKAVHLTFTPPKMLGPTVTDPIDARRPLPRPRTGTGAHRQRSGAAAARFRGGAAARPN